MDSINQTATWGNLQINRRAIAYVPYRDYKISIYESVDTLSSADIKSRSYFFSPILLMEPQSAKYQFKKLTKQHTVSFRVLFWNKDVEARVIEYLRKERNIQVGQSQVTVIPFEELLLKATKSTDVFTVPLIWVKYQQHEAVVFDLVCQSSKHAEELVDLFHNSPDQLINSFEIQLALSTRKAQRKQTIIRKESIVNGNLCAKLMQQFNNDSVYLTAEDTNTLLNESVNNITVETFSDFEIPDSDTEGKIYKVLETFLVEKKELIRDVWDSVFWNDDNGRPDRVAKTLNEEYAKLSQTDKEKLKSDLKNSYSGSGKLAVGVWAVKLGGEGNRANEYSNETNKFLDRLKENKSIVEFEGDVFRPKSMTLNRINLSKLRDERTYNDLNTQVSYSTSTLVLRVNVPQDYRFGIHVQELSNKVSKVVEVLDSTEISTDKFLDFVGRFISAVHAQRSLGLPLYMKAPWGTKISID